MNEILKLSVVELAARIRARRITPLEAVDSYVAAIERVNPRLNAVVETRFDQARTEARAAGERLKTIPETQSLPPLFGVPCTIKEAISVDGMRNTSGAFHFKDRRAPKDATVVQRLRAAGAIPLGVTNVPEGCFWWETDNVVYGRSNNPYDDSRAVGGSSGGEGSIIGAGASPFGIGSDVGGSIRIPAHFCGIFGHKPSHGTIPFTGHWPFYDEPLYTGGRDAFPYATMGPMARHARDLMPILKVIAGPDGFDERTKEHSFGDPDAVDFTDRPVFVLADPSYDRTFRASVEMRDATERAAAHFATLGARLEPVDRRLLKKAFLIWAASLAAVEGAPRMDHLLGGGKTPSIPAEFLRWAARRARHSLPVLQYLLGEQLFKLVKNKQALVDAGDQLRETLERLLGKDGILLVPPHPQVAPPHYQPLFRPFDFTYTAVFNVMKFPVTQVPMGLNAKGLPLGVQVVSTHGNDHLTIAAAQVLEDAFGGWTPPAG